MRHRYHLSFFTALALVAGALVKPALGQTVDITGVWEVRSTTHSGTHVYRWESALLKGTFTRRLISSTDPASQPYLGTELRFRAELSRKADGTWSYNQGLGAFWEMATCSVTSDYFSCKGEGSCGVQRCPITLTGTRIGAGPRKDVKTPIVFLPGVAGTELRVHWKDRSGYPHTTQAWPFSPAEKRTLLALADDGKSVHESVGKEASEVRVEPRAILTSWPTNFYGGLRDYLHKKGYLVSGGAAQEPRQFFEFAYDWRLDNETHFEALDKKIDAALAENPDAKKVILMAHSMGGVIARAYILSSLQRAARVESLITMGTPYWGAPKPYYGAVSGYTFGNPSVLQNLMKVLIQNWPAAYQLMPNYDFVWDMGSKRWLSFDEATGVKYKWFTGVNENIFLPDQFYETEENVRVMNKKLVGMANSFKKQFGTREKPTPLPPGIKHYALVGTGVKTLADFNLRTMLPWQVQRSHLDLDGRKVWFLPCFHDGDGTVSLEGSVISTATTYYIPYVSKWGYDSNSGHSELPANATVQKIIGEILDGKPPDASAYGYAKAEEKIDLEEGVGFMLGSDARLSIKDEQTGQVLGFNQTDGIEENFPSGSFIALENGEYASVADINRPLTATVRGIRKGKFSLEVDVRRRGQPAKHFAFKEIAVEKGTIAQVSLTPANLASSLPSLTVNTGGQIRQVEAVSLPPREDPEHPRLNIPFSSTGQATGTGTLLGSIPSVSGTVESFRFFTANSDEGPPPQALRVYQTRFAKETLKVVYYELTVRYAVDDAMTYIMSAIWKRNNTPLARQDLTMNKPRDWATSTRAYGHGHSTPGRWEPGNYTVDIEVEGRKVASGSFVVY